VFFEREGAEKLGLKRKVGDVRSARVNSHIAPGATPGTRVSARAERTLGEYEV